MKESRSFWENLSYIRNMDLHDIQTAVLAYLDSIEISNKKIASLKEDKRKIYAIYDEQCARSHEYYNENIRLRKALEEARQYPRQSNNEGGWTIKSEFLAEISEMTEDGEYCSMEQVESVLLCAEKLLGEGDKQ